MFGDREYRYDGARYLIVAADVPATARIVSATAQTPYLALKLILDPLEVGEVIAQLGPRLQASPATGALAVGALDPALLDSVIRLVELLESPQVVTGELTLSSISLSSKVDVAAGMCLLPVDGSDSQANPVSRLKAGTCQ
jgi:hypothetical protein